MNWSSNPRTRVSVLRAADVTRDNVTRGRPRRPCGRPPRREDSSSTGDWSRTHSPTASAPGYDAGFETGLDEAADGRRRATAGPGRAIAVDRRATRRRRRGVAPPRRHRDRADRGSGRAGRAPDRRGARRARTRAHARTAGADAIARGLQFAPARRARHRAPAPRRRRRARRPRARRAGPRARHRARRRRSHPGDAVVEVEGCRIDARIGAALERIRALLDSRGRRRDDARCSTR